VAIKVAAWNIEGRLTQYGPLTHGQPVDILSEIKHLNADILVLPEAYLRKPDKTVDDSIKQLKYEYRDASYGNQERDWSKEFLSVIPSIRILSKLKILESEIICFGEIRNLITITVQDPKTKKYILIIATHLDDRSETSRLRQSKDISEYIKTKNMPTIMLGDFNAMWIHDIKGRILNLSLIRFVAYHFPIKIIKDFLVRVCEMSKGDTLNFLEKNASLKATTLRHTPTVSPRNRTFPWMPYISIFQIDHILITNQLASTNMIIINNKNSDHSIVSATIAISD
jgi:endonuclease/exonuclease/phosphatase family metal-dependent hydrolase